jgi:hypothetical protein
MQVMSRTNNPKELAKVFGKIKRLKYLKDKQHNKPAGNKKKSLPSTKPIF